jgi:hypothetical protein
VLSILPGVTHARLTTAPFSLATSQYFGGPAPSWLAITFMSLAILTFAVVVVPAVFGKAELRRAAFRVLDRILRALTGR